jgi:hypothetical protein
MKNTVTVELNCWFNWWSNKGLLLIKGRLKYFWVFVGGGGLTTICK